MIPNETQIKLLMIWPLLSKQEIKNNATKTNQQSMLFSNKRPRIIARTMVPDTNFIKFVSVLVITLVCKIVHRSNVVQEKKIATS